MRLLLLFLTYPTYHPTTVTSAGTNKAETESKIAPIHSPVATTKLPKPAVTIFVIHVFLR